MRFLFTKSNLWGSRLIRWGLGEDVSHVAVQLDLPNFGTPIVVESRLDQGVIASPLAAFLERNQIVHELVLDVPNAAFEELLYLSLQKNAVGRRYDQKGFAFWIAAVLAKKALGRKVPSTNPWGTRKDHLCVEIVRGSERVLEDGLGISLGEIDFEMTSPRGLMWILAKSPRLALR